MMNTINMSRMYGGARNEETENFLHIHFIETHKDRWSTGTHIGNDVNTGQRHWEH